MKAKRKPRSKRRTAALASTKAAKKASSTAVTQFKLDAKITVIAKDNPKRRGSKEAKRFDRYRNGMTVQAARDLGMDNLNLTGDVERGYIKVS